MNIKGIAYIIFTFFVAIISCKRPGLSSRPSLSNSQTTDYQNSAKRISINPQYEIFHVSDTVSELYFQLKSKDFLYTRRDGIDFTLSCLISYAVLTDYNSGEIIDSASVKLIDINNDNTDKLLKGKINLKIKRGTNAVLKIKIYDLNRNFNVTSLIEINKVNDFTRQNFLIKSKDDSNVLFCNNFKLSESVSICYKKAATAKVYVSYYNRNFPLVPPPFSLFEPVGFNYKPDSFFVLQLSPKGSLDFTINKKGFYHIQLDTSTHDGLTLFCHNNDYFPEIKDPQNMLYPMRFITSKEEYDSLETSKNLKAAIEKFWISTTNDKERARQIIKTFYSRVQKANELFTSYIEGWRTDRGMMYLVYGYPGSVYKTQNYESWTYTDETNMNATTFYFTRVKNPFTQNDFTLERSVSYRQSWFLAVDVWRSGGAYYLTE